MRAVIRMWKNTRMIILAAVCAAIYGAALIAFKTAIPLIPGITEVRIANIFPMVFGLLFGPAGAWGTAIGNLIGDIFGGTLGPGSIGGFIGNFMLGYLPYAMWTTLFPFAIKNHKWEPNRWSNWFNYIIIAFISSASCAVIISTVVDALGIVPYAILSKIITLNDTIASWIGLILFVSVFNIIKDQLGLFWIDVMDQSEMASPIFGTLGAWIVTLGSIAGLLGGIFTSVPTTTISWISFLAIIAGSFLM